MTYDTWKTTDTGFEDWLDDNRFDDCDPEMWRCPACGYSVPQELVIRGYCAACWDQIFEKGPTI